MLPPVAAAPSSSVVMKPTSNLCWLCQQNSTAISRSANQPEEEKILVHNIVVTTSTGTCLEPCGCVLGVYITGDVPVVVELTSDVVTKSCNWVCNLLYNMILTERRCFPILDGSLMWV